MGKVDTNGPIPAHAPELGECWVWTWSTNRAGYGLISHYGKAALAHRVSWEMVHGPIEPGMEVCHACDNPPCVRPSHLFLGTHKQNMVDMSIKERAAVGDNHGLRKMPWRSPSGERNGHAKLCEADIVEIRRRHAQGDRVSVLAREYGVVHSAIIGIVKRRTWKRVA